MFTNFVVETYEKARFEEACEILGRDITLADCLLAIGDKWRLEIVGSRQSYDRNRTLIQLLKIWHVTKPMHLQSEETLMFIYNLINK